MKFTFVQYEFDFHFENELIAWTPDVEKKRIPKNIGDIAVICFALMLLLLLSA